MHSIKTAILPFLAAATATLHCPHTTSPEVVTLPLLIWHGLGDSFQGSGLNDIAFLAQEVHPDTYIHIVQLADTDFADRQASFLGNVSQQVATVCEQLTNDTILRTAPAINALGFSQGGQFLRALSLIHI